MPVSRREFLKLLVAGAGMASVPAFIAACNRGGPAPRSPTVPPEPAPTALPVAPTVAATAAPVSPPTATAVAPTIAPPTVPPLAVRAAANRKKVWAWLRMVQAGGVPTSENDYRANLSRIDVVMALNGGTLQKDGSWIQDLRKTGSNWAQNLPQLARKAGQLYMPGMGNDRDGLLAVLDHTDRQDAAAQALVALAKSGRYDSPWDGVYLDLEGAPYEYRAEMSGFLYRLAKAVKDAGLLLGVSVGGVTQATTGTDRHDDATDIGVAGEVGDVVDLRLYDYSGSPPLSIAPYWWVEECIQYALDGKHVSPNKITAGLATYAQYWPNTDTGGSQQITYDQAMQMVKQAGASVEWVESDENGLVRASHARIGAGDLWIQDARAYGYGLDLIRQYRLLGNTVFAPGMGYAGQWQAIEAWAGPRR